MVLELLPWEPSLKLSAWEQKQNKEERQYYDGAASVKKLWETEI